MPHLWLRVAIALYGIGLLYALAALLLRRDLPSRFPLAVAGLGTVFHLVSAVESLTAVGGLSALLTYESESVLALLLMLFFFGIWGLYRTTSHGVFIFPLVFLLSLTAALSQQPPRFESPLLRSGWIYLHITLIFAGYAALFCSFAASLLYLIQEQRLKRKSRMGTGLGKALPSLAVMDDIGLRLLLLGFPIMTLGLIAGSVMAQANYGSQYFRDPKVVLSLLMWAVYMLLLFTRWNAGWRGRRAAVLSAVTFLAATLAWSANYFSSMHRYIAP